MARALGTMKAALFETAKSRGIRDPLTGCYPMSERALSGLLCIYAQRGQVRWDRVPLYSVDTFEKNGLAANLIKQPGSFVAEYVLLHRDHSEECIWGGIPADLLYISSDCGSVVMFENKIGADLQYEPTFESNQLARQLDYLVSLRRSANSASLLVLSAREMLEAGWYRTEFAGALRFKDRYMHAPGHLVTWEDLFDAMAA